MIPQLPKMRFQFLCHIDRMGDISMQFCNPSHKVAFTLRVSTIGSG